MRKKRGGFLIGFLITLGVGIVVLFLPPVWSRVTYHVRDLYTNIQYALFPPEKVVFVPEQTTSNQVATAVRETLTALETPTIEVVPSETQFTATPFSTPIPLPGSIYLDGIRQEGEEWNNCGPTTLAMYLSYWKWHFPGDQSGKSPQDNIAPIVKPNSRDKNVMPYELEDYVMQNTDLLAVVRMGGDLKTIKQLLNAGIPVMIEKGFETEKLGWMGHYELVVGYDDEKQIFKTQDSFLIIGEPDAKYFTISYDEFYQNWRAFNFLFLLVYPQEKQNDVMNLLGPLADEQNAIQIAYDRALSDVTSLTDPRDRYFAWFNMGSSLVKMQNFVTAAAAYDQAFLIYPSIELNKRPQRMLWYQTGPYYAYYSTARYQDVISLADKTFETTSEKVLEESFYWRGLAEIQISKRDEGIADLQKSLEVHPGFEPALSALQSLGIEP